MAYFPAPDELTEGLTDGQRSVAADWDSLVPVRNQVLKALDSAREEKVIGSSLEASVLLTASESLLQLLRKHLSDLPGWFIVSSVQLEQNTIPGDLRVQVERAPGDKCERCWKYTTDVGSNPEFPTVCAACASVLPEYLS
jgi:isoleucyl-tRNA synthetase